MAAINRHLSIAGIAALALASVPAVAEPTKVAQARATDLGVKWYSSSLLDWRLR